MFSGIVAMCGSVLEIKPEDGVHRFRLHASSDFVDGLDIGASVCVNGTCLSVTSIDGENLSFDLVEETMEVTTFDSLVPGDQVNLERSLRFGDEIGGHQISGHISTTARITERDDRGDASYMTFNVNQDWARYIFAKGFIALDGCSLTVAEMDPSGDFTVWLIPETLSRTCFGSRTVGDYVNVEIDAATRAIVETTERLAEGT